MGVICSSAHPPPSRSLLINPDANYAYFVEQGPVLIDTGRRNGDVISIKGETLLCFDRGELPAHHKLMAELKALMRYVLKHYLGENSLKTRVLFQHPSVS